MGSPLQAWGLPFLSVHRLSIKILCYLLPVFHFRTLCDGPAWEGGISALIMAPLALLAELLHPKSMAMPISQPDPLPASAAQHSSPELL